MLNNVAASAPLLQVLLPGQAWQWGGGYQELSDRQTLLQLDFNSNLQDLQGEALLRLEALPQMTQAGMAHAIVLWMDYCLLPQISSPGGNATSMTSWLSEAPDISGEPAATHQAVLLLQQPVDLAVHVVAPALQIKVAFSSMDGSMRFEVQLVKAGTGAF